MTLPSDSGYGFCSDGELFQYFIGLCIDVRTCKFIPLEFMKFNSDSVLMCMFTSAMYCVCMHTFHLAHICMVFNSVKCVHYFYQVNS